MLVSQDNNGDSVLHVAARNNQAAVLQLLLQQESQCLNPKEAVVTVNKQSFTPLAAAAYHGATAAAQLLLAVDPAAATVSDRHGFTPAQLAHRRGHIALSTMLSAAAAATAAAPDRPMAAAERTAAAVAGSNHGTSISLCDNKPRTLIVAPPECELHRTCPDPLPRGMHAPPENVERLRVLVTPQQGILQTKEFIDKLTWETSVAPAPIADVLRVHDWNYVRGLQVSLVADIDGSGPTIGPYHNQST